MIMALWIWFTLTTVVTTHMALFEHHAQETWFRWEFVSKILLMTVVTIVVVDTWSRLRWLLLAIAGSFGLLVLKSLPWLVWTGGQYRLGGPSGTMIDDNNDFALALNMTLPLFLLLARTESDRRLRWLFAFLFAATIPTVFFTYSRGGMVGLTAVLLWMLLRDKRRIVLLPILGLALVLALFFTPAKWKERMDPTSPDFMDASARARLNAWTFSWNLAVDNPLTGGGFDTYTPSLYERYAPDPTVARNYHSIYFGVLAEHGFIGLALYLALLIICFVRLRGLAKWAWRFGDKETENYAAMFQLSLIAYLASGAFAGRQYFDLFFSIVACIAILGCLRQSQGAISPQPIAQTTVSPLYEAEFARK